MIKVLFESEHVVIEDETEFIIDRVDENKFSASFKRIGGWSCAAWQPIQDQHLNKILEQVYQSGLHWGKVEIQQEFKKLMSTS